jgi:phospholipid-binding lipoprotein MlaA
VFAAAATLVTGCGTVSRATRAPSAPAPVTIAEPAPAPSFDSAPGLVPAPSSGAAPSLAPAPSEAPLALAAGEPTAGDAGGAESIVVAAGAGALRATSTESSTPPAAEALLAQAPDTKTPDTKTPEAKPPAAKTPESQTPDADEEAAEDEYAEYDPWEPFNEKMFEFNRRLDRYVLKPVAQAYNFITPEQVQIMISNGFDNIAFPPRFVNSLLQGKFKGAAREIGRFLINSTLGVGGLFDPAKDVFGIVKSREDFGQTLGFYGVGPGPYLILPFLEPLTVRDGIGKAVDSAMDPLAYYLPFIWDRLGMKVGDIINERSLNLDLFQGFEESVIDLYSAVRHGYLQRRQKLIRE